jgi:hypothetical protein
MEAQEGRQSRERPAELAAGDTLKGRTEGRSRPAVKSPRGEARRRPRHGSEGENPGGRKAQESYVQAAGLTPFRSQRTLVRSKTLKVRTVFGSIQHHEGSGAGDGARLHGRSKALKGTTPGADPV